MTNNLALSILTALLIYRSMSCAQRGCCSRCPVAGYCKHSNLIYFCLCSSTSTVTPDLNSTEFVFVDGDFFNRPPNKLLMYSARAVGCFFRNARISAMRFLSLSRLAFQLETLATSCTLHFIQSTQIRTLCASAIIAHKGMPCYGKLA